MIPLLSEDDSEQTTLISSPSDEATDYDLDSSENHDSDQGVNYKKRYSDSRSQYHRMVNEHKKQREVWEAEKQALQLRLQTLEERVNKGEPILPTKLEDVPAFARQHPKLYELLIHANKTVLNEAMPEISKLKSIEEENRKLKQLTKLQQEKDKLLRAYPKAAEIIRSASFKSWLDKQPEYMKESTTSTNADDFIAVLDEYMDYKRKVSQQSGKDGLEALAAPSQGQSSAPKIDNEHIFTEAEIKKMPLEEYAKKADIIKAQRAKLFK